MRALTGLGAFDWFLVGLYAVAIVTLWRAWSARLDGTRRLGILLVPAGAGLAGIVALAVAFPDETEHALGLIPDRSWAIVFAGATLVVALAVVDFLLANTVAWPTTRLLRRGVGRLPWLVDAFVALNVAAVVVVAVAGLSKLSRPDEGVVAAAAGDARVLATYRAGKVVDLVLAGERGYVATDDTISRFTLPAAGEDFELERVATVEHARGLALVGSTLFVSALGPLPCDPSPCPGYEFPGRATEAGDRRYLSRARGRVEAFDVTPEGTLARRRVVLSDLPVVNTLHAVNGITAGPDGLLYLPIGGLDSLYRHPGHRRAAGRPAGRSPRDARHPGIAEQLGVPRADLLGTIVRFAPDGTGLEVVARGLRNVYDLTFDERGNLYAVDNNGPTINGWREEELLRIRPGANYGYPFDGTFGPYSVRTDPPLFVLPAAGSAGVEWAGNVGLGPGLLVGSCGPITHVTLRATGTAVVAEPSDVREVLTLPACVSAIEPGPGGTTVAGLYRFPGDDGPSLYVLRIDR